MRENVRGIMGPGKGSNRLYYRCGSQGGESATGLTCNGKLIPAKWLEERIWEDISSFVMNPGDVVQKLKERMEAASYNQRREHVKGRHWVGIRVRLTETNWRA